MSAWVGAAENPYAPPESGIFDEATEPEFVRIRNEHLKHETSIKGVGLLYCIGGILGLAGMLFVGLTMSGVGGGGSIGAGELLILMAIFAIYGTVLWIGIGLRRLQPWARIPAVVLAALGLLAFPLGTILSAYILYLIVSRKGRMVLSVGYHEIIAATPHIKYRTPVWLWLVLGVVVVGVIALIVLANFR